MTLILQNCITAFSISCMPELLELNYGSLRNQSAAEMEEMTTDRLVNLSLGLID